VAHVEGGVPAVVVQVVPVGRERAGVAQRPHGLGVVVEGGGPGVVGLELETVLEAVAIRGLQGVVVGVAVRIDVVHPDEL